MKRIKGFTLMELVVTISIIVILSVISGPIYNSYSGKARQAEGYVLLGTIRTAQERYRDEYGEFLFYAYSDETCYDEILGIDARTNKYYTKFTAGGYASLFDVTINTKKYKFYSVVYGNGSANLTMYFDRTVGAKIASGSGHLE